MMKRKFFFHFSLSAVFLLVSLLPSSLWAARSSIIYGMNYSNLLHSNKFDTHGYAFNVGGDYRIRDRYFFALNMEFDMHKVPGNNLPWLSNPPGNVNLGKITFVSGLSYFIFRGKLGVQAGPGIGAVIVKDDTIPGNRRKGPFLAAVASSAIIWRPWYPGEFGYNLFVFGLRTDYSRFIESEGNVGNDQLTSGIQVGIEF